MVAISGVQLGESNRTALDYLPQASNLPNVVCLQKPFRPSQVFNAIERALSSIGD